MLKEDRPKEALDAFLRVIKQRSDDAPESHLEAGRLYLRIEQDPIAAIYHFQRFLDESPNSEEAPMVRELIDTAKKDFARTLPGQPYQGEYERLDLLQQIKDLETENENLRRQLGQATSNVAVAAPGPQTSSGSTDAGAVEAVTPIALDANGRTTALAAEAPPGQTAPPPAGPRTYTVAVGDTLSSISSKMYGSPRHWQDIYKANRDKLSSPKALIPGQVLKIP
jgi:nucleoid-associated protein YgaU